MKKKTTRKIRRNKRTTQRRKNRSYKRMRGGWGEKKKIVKLLRNLIINNYSEDAIRKLCEPQSLPTAEKPLPTVEQPLLSPAGQPLLLKNAEQVNERLIAYYSAIISPTHDGKFEYTFYDEPISKSIIEALNTQNISYFDQLVKNKSKVNILSPDEFKKSLTSSSSSFTGMFIKDALVYSMFALAQRVITLIPIIDSNGTAKIDLTDKVCPPISDV